MNIMIRGIITISETGTIMMPAVPVWMTQFEIADLFGVFSCDVRKAIHAIYKNKELNELDTMQYVRQPNGIGCDVYSLEMVMAVSFRVQSKRSRIFRQYVMKRLSSGKDGNAIPSVYLVVYKDGFNRQGKDKGNIYN